MRVAVLGGGLQGACVAMELASAGIAVDLYDKNDRCLTQASAQNEGKIHLGYVYANDRSGRTARTMLRGAIAFSPLLRRWIGDEIDTVPVSAPFHYAVHASSLLGVAEVESHLRASHEIALHESDGVPPDYFGYDYRAPAVRLSETECASLFDARAVAAAFRTPEVGIDPEVLAALVRVRLADDPDISCVLGARVRAVREAGNGLSVDFETDGVNAREGYDHVVNTLWDGRLAIDRTVGLRPERPWLYRVKHFLRLGGPSRAGDVPSTTIVVGPFGDVVAFGGGDLYLSWYPAGMTGASSALDPPAWPLMLDEPDSRMMRRAILDGLARVVPAIDELDPDAIEDSRVEGGIIFAWGDTDIADPASGLHQRYAIGPRSRGCYHTVDTGKLTMAPLFGKAVADRIRQIA